jgi:hypothetical protein
MERDIAEDKVESEEFESYFDDKAQLDLLFDMETQDPDDWFTLCFLCSHPRARLRAVTIYPGSKMQIGLVKETLKILRAL